MKSRLLTLLLLTSVLFAQTPPARLANGWLVRPLGRQTQLDQFPISTALSPDGQYLLVLSAGEKPTVRAFATKTEKQVSSLAVPNAWLGLAFSPNGRLVYVGGGTAGAVYELRLSPEGELALARTMPASDEKPTEKDTPPKLIGDVAVTPDGRMVYATDVLRDQVVVINLSSGRAIERYPAGRRPYRIAFHPNGKTYFVTGWADGNLTQYETINGKRFNGIPVGSHPTDIAWRDKKTLLEEGEEAPWAARMFIPAANTNNVYSVAITETSDLRVVESIALGLFVDSPVGMTPSAVALNPDQSRLYVACSDANAVAVVDVSGVKGRLLGFMPTGEYPTALRVLNDGRIVVLNGGGSALFLNPPTDQALGVPTGMVLGNSPLKQIDPRQRPIAMNAIPFTPGEPTPIEHVIYIMNEAKPYTAAGEQAAPNQLKLSKEFTPLSGFAVPGETPVDGFYWSTAAIVPDYVQKLRRASVNLDVLDIGAQPPAGYLWNQTAAKLYGIVPTARGARGVIAAPSANTEFRGPDRSVADVDRAQVFLKELAQFEQQQSMPKLLILRLAGARPVPVGKGQRTEQAAIADNDYALGLIIERLSHSKYWPKMAIFIATTSAADRTPNAGSAFIVSPFAKRGASAAGSYNTLSILRTMEKILGLAPMTQFDAGATTLDDSFQLTPDLRPFDAERPRIATDTLAQ